MRVLIGYFIRRSIAKPDAVRGKTFAAYGHTLYSTHRIANDALLADERFGLLDRRYEYDIAEAWMHIDDAEVGRG